MRKGKDTMKGTRLYILSLAALIVHGAETVANASVVPQRAPTYFSLATSGGARDPGIIVGFNPQPDPPGRPLPSLDLTIPDHLLVTESDGTTFNFVLSFLGVPGALLPAVDQPTFDVDIDRWTTNFGFEYGGDTFDVYLDFSGSPAEWAAFNPQPDPPGDVLGYTISFPVDASVGVQIQEDSSNLSFSAVPEPSTWGMMVLGFAALGFISLRSRRSARPA